VYHFPERASQLEILIAVSILTAHSRSSLSGSYKRERSTRLRHFEETARDICRNMSQDCCSNRRYRRAHIYLCEWFLNKSSLSKKGEKRKKNSINNFSIIVGIRSLLLALETKYLTKIFNQLITFR